MAQGGMHKKMRKIAFSGRFCSVRTPTYGFARAISTIREAVPPSSQDFGAVHAADSGIVSSDIVGYNTQSITGGKLNCAAFQFTGIGSKNATLANLSTTGLTPGEYESMNTDAPCVMIYNGIGYDNYYYISDAGDNFDETAWADADGNVAGEVGIPSTGFWLRIPEATCTDGTLTESGAVDTDATTTISIASNLTLAGNPYPAALNMSKVTTTGLVPGEYDTMNTDAPCIMIYNGVGYDNYYYISDAGDNFDETAWADADGNVAETIAAPGAGFWLRSSTVGSLTFSL